MQYRVLIEGQDTTIWTRGGTVEGVMGNSSTQVWSSGGGGYVGPNGGYVSAPSVHSRTTHNKEVRFVSEAGQRSTYTIGGHVTVMPGDRVSFVYASHASKQNGPMVGFINHTENVSWSFDSYEVLPYQGHWGLRGGVALGLLVALLSSFLFFLFCCAGVVIAWIASKNTFFQQVNEALRRQVHMIRDGIDPRQVENPAVAAVPHAAAMNLS